MSSQFIEPDPTVGSVVPADDEQPSFLDQIADADATTLAADDDLIVTQEPPPPLGRAWAYDFALERHVTGTGAGGVLEIRGEATLAQWVEKCIRTPRGSSVVHPPWYGLEGGIELGGPIDEPPYDLEAKIRDAVTRHPRVTGISGYSIDWDSDDEAWFVYFVVQTDYGTDVPIQVRV